MDEGYLTFALGQEIFAVPLSHIEEILEPQEVIPVPEAPHFVEGILNLRGTVLPLISLYKRFGLTPAETCDGQIIIVDAGGIIAGLRVDEVRGILKSEELHLEPMPEVALTAVNREFLKEVGKREDTLIFVLNLGKILSIQERDKLTGTTEESAPQEKNLVKNLADLYVRFTMEGQDFAVPIEAVGEVLTLVEQIRPIPFTPADFLGLINLRGEVLWVVDIRRFLSLPSPPRAYDKAIVLQDKDIQLAFPVQESTALMSIPAENILPVLSTLEGLRAELVKGEIVLSGNKVLKGKEAKGIETEKEIVILLNVPRLLRHAIQDVEKSK